MNNQPSNNKIYNRVTYVVMALGLLLLVAIIAIATYVVIEFAGPYVMSMTFQTPKSSVSDDYDFDAKIYTPRDHKKTHPVIIVSHGYNSTMENCEDVAEYYSERGIATIVFDFVGGSRNSSTGVHSSEMTAYTEITDYEIVLDYVKEHDEYDNNNIFISGQSFGGLIATVVAEKHQDEINSVVLFYPAYYMADYAKTVLEEGPTEQATDDSPNIISTENVNLYDWDGLLVSEKYLTELSETDIRGIISNLHKDVLILQGDIDDDVTLSSTQYYMTFFPSAQLVIIKDGEHGFFDEQLLQAEEASYQFMTEHLHVL